MATFTEGNAKLYITGGVAAIGGFLSGYHTGVISGVFTTAHFIKTFGNAEGELTNDIKGGIIGSLMAGCILGALIAGPTSDRFSRKYSIILSSIIFVIGATLQTASSGLPMLLVARVVSGVAVGAFSVVVPIYLSEIATKEYRGQLVSLVQLGITIGLGVSFWIDYGMNVHLPYSPAAWRIPFALQIVPALLLAVGIYFCPFSPRWLMSKARESDALNVLKIIRCGAPSDIQEELDGIKREIVLESEQEVQSCLPFGNASLRRRLILGIGIQIFQQFSGINSIMYYAPEIFKQAGSSDNTASLLTTGINGCVNILATIPTILLIDKVGRRRVLIAGAIVMALSMMTVGGVMSSYVPPKTNETMYSVDISMANTATSDVIIIFIYIFVAGFAFSWGPVMWVYCTELFPLSMRAKGTSIMLATNWAANCALSFIIPVLLNGISYGTYIVFGILCVIIGIFTFLFYPETKGIPLERMNELFRGPILVCSHSNMELPDIDDRGYLQV